MAIPRKSFIAINSFTVTSRQRCMCPISEIKYEDPRSKGMLIFKCKKTREAMNPSNNKHETLSGNISNALFTWRQSKVSISIVPFHLSFRVSTRSCRKSQSCLKNICTYYIDVNMFSTSNKGIYKALG